MPEDYYRILGVRRDAGPDEIKAAFRRAVRRAHPDASPSADETALREILEAHTVLSRPDARALYDGIPQVLSGRQPAYRPDPFYPDGYSSPRRAPLPGFVVCSTCHGWGTKSGTGLLVCSSCGGSGRNVDSGWSIRGKKERSSACSACRGWGRVPQVPCGECGGVGVFTVGGSSVYAPRERLAAPADSPTVAKARARRLREALAVAREHAPSKRAADSARARVRQLGQDIRDVTELLRVERERRVAAPPAAPPPQSVVPEPAPAPTSPRRTSVEAPIAQAADLRWNLVRLGRLVSGAQSRYPDRLDEWDAYLYFLREHAAADGTLPERFHALVEDVFGPLLELDT